MTVFFIYDDYGIDTTSEVVVERSNIAEIRERIRSHLLHPVAGRDLRIQISKQYRLLYKDFLGLSGVECICIEPRRIFSQIHHVSLPAWLSNELIVSLGYLQLGVTQASNPEEWADDITGWLLYLLVPNLVKPGAWSDFCAALKSSLLCKTRLFHVPEVQDRLVTSAQAFIPLNIALQVVAKLVAAPAAVHLLECLGQEQIYEKLRTYTLEHNVAYPLPPRIEPADLIKALPPIIIEKPHETKIQSDLLGLLDAALHAIQERQLPVERLAELCVLDNPSFFAHLRKCFDESTISLASQELAAVLGEYQCEEAKSLLALVRQQLLSCPPLPADVDTQTARAWIPAYLDYALRRFYINQEPEDTVSMSFSNWVINQQARISRSNLDWRCVANSITQHLENPTTRVIICMVDALGAAHNNQIIEILRKRLNLESLNPEIDFLIAPYPTLTEIGKNAVLTGKPVNETNGSVQDRLFQAYKAVLDSRGSIHVIKSWSERADLIEENTRLLVYLENRIDERLHGCLDYSKFHKDVEVIIKQLANEISKWITLSEKHGYDPVIIITADHGLTYINNTSSPFIINNPQATISDRVFSFTHEPPSLQGYLRNEAGGKHFLIPLNRVRLQGQTPLVHGGLTPEELIIPYITLSKSSSPPPSLQIIPKSDKAYPYQEVWQLELAVHTPFPSENIRLSAQPPFTGKAGPYGPLKRGDRIDISLPIHTDLSQEGLVKIDLVLTFYRPDLNGSEQHYITLPIHFPPRLLERDEDVAAFNDMFS